MSKILIDNWSIQNFASTMMEDDDFPAFVDIIQNIVLWDELYYIDSPNSLYWKKILKNTDVQNIFIPLETGQFSFSSNPYYEYCKHLWFFDDHDYDIDLIRKALEYLTIGNSYGLDYCPVQQRAAFLQEQQIIIRTNRDFMIDFHNRELNKWYNEVNKIIEMKQFEFKMPVLFDYIVQNIDNKKDYVKAALELKNAFYVKQFKKWMDEFEKQIDQNNSLTLMKTIKDFQDVILSFKEIQTTTIEFDINITPTPNLTIPIKIPLTKRYFQKIFLKKLTKFALTRRKDSTLTEKNI